jgi:DNA polymerase-3 subunit epsilon
VSKPIIYFDLECGGLELHHPITQIGAVAFQDGKELSRFEVKLKFNLFDCDPEALKINGYSKERWLDAVEPARACALFSKWLSPYKTIEKVSQNTGNKYKIVQLAGYNAATFDAPRLQKLFKDQGAFLPASYQVLDVMQLVMWFYQVNPESRPENIKLATVCETFGITLDNAHDALADVIATAQLAQRLLNRE